MDAGLESQPSETIGRSGHRAVAAASEAPSGVAGAAAGGSTVLVFAALHDVWISDIWWNIVPMVFAGSISGLAISWSYRKAVPAHTTWRWLGYNGLSTALLVALGVASLLVLDPKHTMAQAMAMDDALAVLLPPAAPLMIWATVGATLVAWSWFGRRRAALVPILLTQGLLMFLVGHNLAILGLVELSGGLIVAFLEFVGLTFFLGGVFAVGAMLATAGFRAFRP